MLRSTKEDAHEDFPAKRIGTLALSILLCLTLAAPVLAEEPVVYTSDALTASRTR